MNINKLKALIARHYKDATRRERLLVLFSFLELGGDGQMAFHYRPTWNEMMPFFIRNEQTDAIIEFVTDNADMFSELVHRAHKVGLSFHETLDQFSMFTTNLVRMLYREEKHMELPQDAFDHIYWADVLAPFWYAFSLSAFHYEYN